MEHNERADLANWVPSTEEISEALAKVMLYPSYYSSPEFLGKFDLIVKEVSHTKKLFAHYPILPSATREDLLCMNAAVILACREYGVKDLDMFIVKNEETLLYGHALEITLETPIVSWISNRDKSEVN